MAAGPELECETAPGVGRRTDHVLDRATAVFPVGGQDSERCSPLGGASRFARCVSRYSRDVNALGSASRGGLRFRIREVKTNDKFASRILRRRRESPMLCGLRRQPGKIPAWTRRTHLCSHDVARRIDLDRDSYTNGSPNRVEGRLRNVRQDLAQNITGLLGVVHRCRNIFVRAIEGRWQRVVTAGEWCRFRSRSIADVMTERQDTRPR